MSNEIHQFNVSFEPVEDRLLLRALTHSDEEIRVWLTRRYVRLLYKAIENQQGSIIEALQQQEALNALTDPMLGNSKGQSTEAQQGKAPASASPTPAKDLYAEAYQSTENTKLPYGDEPLLVTRISLQEEPEGVLNLVLGEEHEGGMQMEMRLPQELLQSLVNILQEAAKSAEWDLSLQVNDFSFNISHAGARLH